MAERNQYPSEKQDRFIVRLPDGMRDRIKRKAEENSRSMNAEIIATLSEKYPAPDLPFGTLVRLRREEVGISKTELANEVGVSCTVIHGIESEDKAPSLQNLAKIIHALDIPAELAVNSLTVQMFSDD